LTFWSVFSYLAPEGWGYDMGYSKTWYKLNLRIALFDKNVHFFYMAEMTQDNGFLLPNKEIKKTKTFSFWECIPSMCAVEFR